MMGEDKRGTPRGCRGELLPGRLPGGGGAPWRHRRAAEKLAGSTGEGCAVLF